VGAAKNSPASGARSLVTPPAAFKGDLLELSSARFIRKWLVFGTCKVYSNEHDYYALVEKVADHFGVHPTSVFAVGSAKLGFSIAPKKRYMAFDENRSDIDLVIVSDRLFDKIWEEIYVAKATDMWWSKRDDFLKYLFRGWLRPDFFPDVRTATADGWFDFFASVSKDQPAKVTGAIYRTWSFFETYQANCVGQCADAERGLLTT
jgi:hypothetical protein